MNKLKYPHIESNYSYETTESWMNSFGKAAGARREIRELCGPEEPVSTIVYVPSTFLGPAGALFRSFGLPARSQLHLATFPGTCWLWTKGPLRNNKVSPQATGRQASTPGILSAFCAPTSFPKLPENRKPTQKSLPHKTTFSTTNEREKAEELC